MGLNGFKGLEGVTFRLTGDKARVDRMLGTENGKFLLEKKVLTRERLVAQDSTPIQEITLTSAESIQSKDWPKDAPYLPESTLTPGEDVHFKAYILLSIFAGRVVDRAHPSDAFVRAYETVLGPEISMGLDVSIVALFLQGKTTPKAMAAAILYALKPIRAIEWTQVIQLYRNIQRMVSQAA
jgi:hypothetical protein